MKANELRIGNCIQKYHSPQDSCIDIVDVDMLSTIDENGCISGEPIPLTEEWLLKLGFVIQPKYNYLKDWLYIQKGKFAMNNARGFWSHSPIYLEDVIEIKYVHQLQNLYFALTGEELTWN